MVQWSMLVFASFHVVPCMVSRTSWFWFASIFLFADPELDDNGVVLPFLLEQIPVLGSTGLKFHWWRCRRSHPMVIWPVL